MNTKTFYVTLHGKCDNCSTVSHFAILVARIDAGDELGKIQKSSCQNCGSKMRAIVVGQTLYPFVARPDVD